MARYVDSKHPLVRKLNRLYKALFRHQSTATAASLTLLSLAMLVFNACTSIYFSYKRFLRDLADKCLNAYYYTLNESRKSQRYCRHGDEGEVFDPFANRYSGKEV